MKKHTDTTTGDILMADNCRINKPHNFEHVTIFDSSGNTREDCIFCKNCGEVRKIEVDNPSNT